MLALDHLVIAAKDPLKSAEHFAKKHDIKAVQGGKHPMWGTHNALAYFQKDCYIEWIGIFDEAAAKHSNNPLIQQLITHLSTVGEGLFQYGLRTTNMDYYVKHFTKNNVSFVGPLNGKRSRPDGSTLSWRMLFPTSHLLVTPFLIEWGDENFYGADPKVVNERQLTLYLNEKENLKLFQKTFQIKESHGKIALQNRDILLTPNALLHVEIED